MKKYIWMSLGVATLTALAACGTKDRNFAAARYAKLKGQTDKTGIAACVPGQAGTVYVGGILLTTSDGGNKLDDRVSTQTISGANSAASKKSVAANGGFDAVKAPLAETLTTLTAQSSLQTYVSFGCDDTQLPTEFKNWKAVTFADGAITSANTIYVCGKQVVPSAVGNATLIADQMVMAQDASLTLKSKANSGGLSILVNKLGLKGSNSIGAQITDAQTSFQGTGLPVSVNVMKSLDADSSSKLSLTSTGGSCVAASTSTDTDQTVDTADTAAQDAEGGVDKAQAAIDNSQAVANAAKVQAGVNKRIATEQKAKMADQVQSTTQP